MTFLFVVDLTFILNKRACHSPASPPYHSPATLCTFFLQILPFMLIHKPLFRLYLTEAIIVKSASIISNVVRAVDSGLVNTLQKCIEQKRYTSQNTLYVP